MRVTLFFASITLLLTPLMSHAETAYDKLAAQVAKLRQEVQALSTEVEGAQEEARPQRRSYRNQIAELELRVQRERIRTEKVQKDLNDLRAEVARDDSRRTILAPAVEEAAKNLEQWIASGIPFKVTERQKQLNEILAQMKDGTVTADKSAARLWNVIEDEKRLSKESGLYQQVIQVDGKEELADLARIGLVALYVRLNDGRVGYAQQGTDATWNYTLVQTPEQSDQIHALFDAFKKNIRVGLFTLPSAF